MLRLTLEIVPFGIEDLKRPIGMLHVALRDVHFDNHGDYHVYSYDHTGELKKEFNVTDHKRDQPNGAWELVRRTVECLVDKDLR